MEIFQMAKKLYVGGLSYSTTETDLRGLFADAGTIVSVTIITDRDSGMSKGFGFVEMSTDQEAQAAINKFNGQDFAGRTLTVNEARPPREGGGGGGYRGGGGGRGYGGGGGGGGFGGGGGGYGGGGYGGGGGGRRKPGGGRGGQKGGGGGRSRGY
jgi:RNA recognition motif-containing protein